MLKGIQLYNMSNWEKFKKFVYEWLKTLSSKPGFFSSKRLERFVFSGVVVLGYITTIGYLVYSDKLSATEFAIASTPLLLAAGYNLGKTEEAKKLDNQNNG